ncbi:MAG: hypothetical protein LBQ43_04055 [Holosporales bacterium]|jgi:hypothetical protein|nr:hypothetical protein [Holosporales bacterium]
MLISKFKLLLGLCALVPVCDTLTWAAAPVAIKKMADVSAYFQGQENRVREWAATNRPKYKGLCVNLLRDIFEKPMCNAHIGGNPVLGCPNCGQASPPFFYEKHIDLSSADGVINATGGVYSGFLVVMELVSWCRSFDKDSRNRLLLLARDILNKGNTKGFVQVSSGVRDRALCAYGSFLIHAHENYGVKPIEETLRTHGGALIGQVGEVFSKLDQSFLSVAGLEKMVVGPLLRHKNIGDALYSSYFDEAQSRFRNVCKWTDYAHRQSSRKTTLYSLNYCSYCPLGWDHFDEVIQYADNEHDVYSNYYKDSRDLKHLELFDLSLAFFRRLRQDLNDLCVSRRDDMSGIVDSFRELESANIEGFNDLVCYHENRTKEYRNKADLIMRYNTILKDEEYSDDSSINESIQDAFRVVTGGKMICGKCEEAKDVKLDEEQKRLLKQLCDRDFEKVKQIYADEIVRTKDDPIARRFLFWLTVRDFQLLLLNVHYFFMDGCPTMAEQCANKSTSNFAIWGGY